MQQLQTVAAAAIVKAATAEVGGDGGSNAVVNVQSISQSNTDDDGDDDPYSNTNTATNTINSDNNQEAGDGGSADGGDCEGEGGDYEGGDGGVGGDGGSNLVLNTQSIDQSNTGDGPNYKHSNKYNKQRQ